MKYKIGAFVSIIVMIAAIAEAFMYANHVIDISAEDSVFYATWCWVMIAIEWAICALIHLIKNEHSKESGS